MSGAKCACDLRTPQGFVDLLSGESDWMTIDEVVALCDEAGFWDRDFETRALANAKKAKIRRAIGQLKDKHGLPKFPSIMITDDEGVKKRVYKQETLFDVEDYKTIVNCHVALANHHRDRAIEYVKRCERRHEVQLLLWELGEGFDEAIDSEWTAPTEPTTGQSPGEDGLGDSQNSAATSRAASIGKAA